MDPAVLRERRMASRRRVVRRRLFAGAAALAAVLLVLVLRSSGGGSRSASPPATPAAVRVAPPPAARAARAGRAVPPPAPVMPGAHRAPHEAVPILMYHVIGEHPSGTPNAGLWVTPADFVAEVHALRRAGYHGVTLQQVWSAWHRHGRLPSRPVVMSFDDGYLGQVRDALPALAAVGWPGVLNLVPSHIKDMGGTRAIRRMIRAGWEIDSHTITHVDLTTAGPERLRHELTGSRALLRRSFDVPVRFFCYPSGRYDAAVIAAVKAAGYAAATTTQLGWARPAEDPFTLSRIRVDGALRPGALPALVRAARPAPA